MDSEKRQIGLWSADTINFQGGFGTDEAGLFDPIDIISNQLDIFILDQSENRYSRFDSQLNFISSFNFMEENLLYPSLFSIDSRQNIYIYYPEVNILYRTKGIVSQLSQFLDLNSEINKDNCISDLDINEVDVFGLLYGCNRILHLYSRFGKLIRRFNIQIKDPFIILPFQSSWIIINESGEVEFLDENPIILFSDKKKVKDAIVDEGKLFLLLDTSLLIYDIIDD